VANSDQVECPRREVRPDLEGATLKLPAYSDDTYDAFLEGVNLRGANLKGVDLSATLLKGADLADADLQGADLTAANLKGAKLPAPRQ
jgi:uncharacterized protein YjbI with pentapeptide repeats